MFGSHTWAQLVESKPWLPVGKYQRVDLTTTRPHWVEALRARSRTISKAIGLLLVAALLLSQLSTSGSIPSAPLSSTVSYFHLLVPASEPNANLCKTLFSAAALDYPTPRILNWGKHFDNPNLIFGGSHIAKIEGILDFLRELGPQSDNELGLIIDGYDVWFQLRPSVMIQRYHSINARANERIKAQLGNAADHATITQRVVFSSQKRCWPAGPDDPECFAVPESDLPPKVYGSETDKNIGDERNPYVNFRQRYLNSGTIIGPIRDLRAIFERAFEKANKDQNIGSDQGIFASIFGEQEYQREVLRTQHLHWYQRLFFLYSRDRIVQLHPTHHHMKPVEGTSYEFGIGLDYRSELSQPTVFSEDDLTWLQRSDSVYKTLPADSMRDVIHSTPPFWTFDSSLEVQLKWDQVPLYTNTYTGISPAAIHHNAHRDGLKSRIQTFWNQTWYYPHLRSILQSQAAAPRMPSAVLSGPDGSAQEWWGPTDERGGLRIENGVLPGDWLGWEDVCGTTEIAEEVFGDGKGQWRDKIYLLDWNQTKANEQLEKWHHDLKSSS